MTADRSRAYARVLSLLDDLGPAKLHAAEQAVVREAADALVLSTDLTTDDEAREALGRLDDLVERLVDRDRLIPETGESVLDAVEACGPPTLTLRLVA